MASSTVNMRIRKDIHSDIKAIADKEKRGVQEVTDEFLLFALKHYHSDEVMRQTDIEKIINNRISKTDELIIRSVERLAGLEARVGIDNSMTLMGVIILLVKLLKLDKKDVQSELRKQGAIYFSSAIKEDKDKKKEGK